MLRTTTEAGFGESSWPTIQPAASAKRIFQHRQGGREGRWQQSERLYRGVISRP
jgi:hypothetical protein